MATCRRYHRVAGKRVAHLVEHNVGKTYTLATTVKRAVQSYGVKKMTILCQTSRDVHMTIVPAIMEAYDDNDPNKPTYKGNLSTVVWPNGAKALIVSSEAGKDSVRGNNVELLLADEVVFYSDPEIITQALLTCRLGMSKAFFFTTPKPTKMLIDWIKQSEDKDATYVKLVKGSTFDNEDNLADNFMKSIVSSYKGTSLERTELYGELLLDNDAALWTRSTIEANTVEANEVPHIVEYCIGLDPALTSKTSAAGKRKPDEVGIVVSGLGTDGLFYVLENYTHSASVEKWVNKVIQLFNKYSHSAKTKIYCESNAGGAELLSSAFDRQQNGFSKHIDYKFSSNSKLARAFPYALMSEQGKIKFVNTKAMDELFTEMCTYDGTGKSPNALDGFTFSMSGLSPMKKHYTNVSELLF